MIDHELDIRDFQKSFVIERKTNRNYQRIWISIEIGKNIYSRSKMQNIKMTIMTIMFYSKQNYFSITVLVMGE